MVFIPRLWILAFVLVGWWILGRGLASFARGIVVIPSAGTFVLSSLIDGGPLSYAVVMALPDNVGIWRKSKDAFDGFTIHENVSL